MSDYTQSIDFSAKDDLPSGDAGKAAKGADLDTELALISTAIASKYDSADIATQSQAEALTSDAVLLTPDKLNDVLQDNAGMAGDIQALADPNDDRILAWDDSAGAVINADIGNGLTMNASGIISVVPANVDHDALLNFSANEHIDHASVSILGGVGIVGGGFITASRSLALDISGITAHTGTAATSDGFLIDEGGTMGRKSYDSGWIQTRNSSGTSDSLNSADLNSFISYSNGSNINVTLNTGVGDIGNWIILHQGGAGTVSIIGTATIESADSLTQTRTQDSVVVLFCRAADTWVLYGDMG